MPERISGKEYTTGFSPDVIVVLSSGLYRSSVNSNGLKPSWDARIRLVAAAELYDRQKTIGQPPQLIITGGNVYKGQPELSHISRLGLVNSYKIPEE